MRPALMRNLLRFGFPKDRIYPVNPRYERLFELPCYPSISAVPGDVDLAVIAIPRDGTVAVMEELRRQGRARRAHRGHGASASSMTPAGNTRRS